MSPAAATINAALQSGWRPARPDLWLFEEGLNVGISNSPFARFQTIARAQVDMQNELWKQAAKHEHGGGLETGIPSMQSARNATKYLRKHGYYTEATALEYVLVGFFRDPDDNTKEHMMYCSRCARRIRATRFHNIYGCSDNLAIDAEQFIETNKIVK